MKARMCASRKQSIKVTAIRKLWRNATPKRNNTVYESPNISNDQRIGDESEELTVTFSTDDGPETYSPGSVSEFQQFTIGSTWILKMNALGGVIGVEP